MRLARRQKLENENADDLIRKLLERHVMTQAKLLQTQVVFFSLCMS